jgi:hypothetical protein
MLTTSSSSSPPSSSSSPSSTTSLSPLQINTIIQLSILNIPGAIICLLFLLWKLFYFWWIKNEIAYLAAILRASLRALPLDAIVLSFISILFKAAWIGLMIGAWYKLNQNIGNSGWALMVLAGYWTLEVIGNVLTVAICSAVAVWFSQSRRLPCSSLPGLLQALTSKLGSICFGSLIVAALAAFRYLFKRAKNSKCRSFKCIILCCLGCLQSVVEIFNEYAFVQVAAYDMSYLQSARETADLFATNAASAVANDDLIDGVLHTAQSIVALTTMVVGGVMAHVAYSMPWQVIALVMVAGM